MTMVSPEIESGELVLAAEECEPNEFEKLHVFSRRDKRVIAQLMAHGPILLQGGRGSGKSALMIAAARGLAPNTPESGAIGIYMSLRELPLLRSTGQAYEDTFCALVAARVRDALRELDVPFDCSHDPSSLRYHLNQLSGELGKRIVLLFDDAAHIGREAPLAEFFDIFRMLSGNTVSCKASIYPGVTQFGQRFDVYNDATVVDVFRDEEQPGFAQQFTEVIQARFPQLARARFVSPLTLEKTAGFLGQSVVGFMRAFVFACSDLCENMDESGSIGVKDLGSTLMRLATNHYWPLLEEVRPKLGRYEPMVEPAIEIAREVFAECAKKAGRRTAVVHREIIGQLPKAFEILEYVGFIGLREASRAMKSGGRGKRFVLNLCLLLEEMPQTRLTKDMLETWTSREREDPVEFHIRGNNALPNIQSPAPRQDGELSILHREIDILKKSNAYPYGLTDHKVDLLKGAEISTVGKLAETTDEELKKLRSVGEATVRRFRNVVGQAIWM